VALLDKRLDHGDHGADLLGGAGAHIGIEHVGGAHDADELVRELRRDLGGSAALLVGALDDLVIDIGEVLGERDLVAARDEPATNHVKADERAGIADVDIIVNGRAADVDAILAGHLRDELFFLTGQGVENLHKNLSFCVADRSRDPHSLAPRKPISKKPPESLLS